VTLKHDASRIIQSMLKYANAEQRFKISSELKGRFKDLANGKYGGFVVEKILKYCPSLRPVIFSEFQSHASRLILHLSTSLIINSLYTTYCTPVQRTALIQELYHPSFTHFKDAEYKSFKDVMKKEEWKAGALKHSLNIVQKVCEKGLLGSLDIVQRLAGEVIEVLGETDDADKLQNLLTTLSPQLLPSLHTKPGSYLTQLCILHGTPKIRKNILKSFKGYIPKIAAEEYGYAVLLRVFDCVDDTVMVSKTILNELLNEPQLLFNDTHALKVAFYLLSPRHPKYTPSHVLSSFKESDHIRSQTSKKDNYQRSRELLKAADDKILKYLCD
ncbi:armadillo-type protein, partial [Paraphysoderma sedebokerense]